MTQEPYTVTIVVNPGERAGDPPTMSISPESIVVPKGDAGQKLTFCLIDNVNGGWGFPPQSGVNSDGNHLYGITISSDFGSEFCVVSYSEKMIVIADKNDNPGMAVYIYTVEIVDASGHTLGIDPSIKNQGR